MTRERARPGLSVADIPRRELIAAHDDLHFAVDPACPLEEFLTLVLRPTPLREDGRRRADEGCGCQGNARLNPTLRSHRKLLV